MLSLEQRREEPSVCSIAEAADIVSSRLGRKVRAGTIRYLITSGKVADVARAGGKRVFSGEDVETLVAALTAGPQQGRRRERATHERE
ncbi:MAG: hypothetical protein FJ290_25575 [Planctomycetes bacterium]|nr:hypothetical protein [Planctomycetota bacterium]